MKNWDAFIIVSSFVIALALFATEKIGFHNMLENLKPGETIVVMVKTATVALLGSITLAVMVVVLIIDIFISLIMQAEFPIMHFFYDTIFLDYFMGLYWEAHTGSHILMACIALFGIGLINSYLGPIYRKKTFVYYKTKQNNYIHH
jgi:hypothetical protein